MNGGLYMKVALFFWILTAVEFLEIAMALYLSVGGFKFTESEPFITTTKLCLVGSFFTMGAALAIGLGSLLMNIFSCFL